MAEHRDSPGLEPDEAGDSTANRGRRFVRMVATPAARRVALPRLAAAGSGVLVLVILLVAIGSWTIRSVTRWVAARPEHQIKFSEIELVPSPEPWVIGGARRILDEVRADAHLGETLPILELDLMELGTVFKRCPWVKEVARVDRSEHGRLIVHLAYRKPVAAVVIPATPNELAYPIDDEAVALPVGDIDWESQKYPFQIKGIDGPLIVIRGVHSSRRPRFGVPWKRSAPEDASDDPDLEVLGAARLADFLRKQERSTASGKRVPTFLTIHLPPEPGLSFFLEDAELNLVAWGKPPGEEKAGEPSGPERWRMLLNRIEKHGPLSTRKPKYLYFDRAGAKVFNP